jgi:RNA polymerase primary sigma factor
VGGYRQRVLAEDHDTQKIKESDQLAPYMDAIRAFPVLTREEERRLAVRARRGDVSARQELVRHNLGLVVRVARAQSRSGVRLDDLVQEGNLGLLRAVEKFDPDAGARFATYATWWIRAFVWKYLKEARSTVKPKAGVAARSDVSLDAPIGDEHDLSPLDGLEDERPDPEETFLSSDGDRHVRESLERVRKRVGKIAWDVIQSRLSRESPDTLEQIGARWNLSRERVRQIERETKRFLEGYLGRMRDAEAERQAA